MGQQEQEVNPELTEESLEDELDRITEAELDNEVTRMKNGKSPSCDGIVTEIMKDECDLK